MSEFFTQFGIDWKLLLSQFVNFALILIILRAFVYKPLLKMLNERREKIEQGLVKAEESDIRLKEVDNIAKGKLKEAEQKSLAMLSETDSKKKQLEKDLFLKMKQKEEQLLLKAEESAELHKKEINEKIQKEAAEIIGKAIAKAIDEEPEQVDEKLIRKAVSRIK
ncbi:MAG: hypothetical protein HYT36_02930 [Candidatus Staskawiczbacteria bacterium]|nr:hypothetical protein [Candidatus Staskawiczbacteria bacterium]